jgi:hypothetical protein
VDFLPAPGGGLVPYIDVLPEHLSVPAVRSAQKNTKLLQLTKDVSQLRGALRKQFDTVPWIRDLAGVMRSSPVRDARVTRDMLVHRSPIFGDVVDEAAIGPMRVIELNRTVDWQSMVCAV